MKTLAASFHRSGAIGPFLAAAIFCLAATASGADPGPVNSGSLDGFFGGYFARVDQTQAEQPHWITPLFTTTPRLEEEVRYDVQWQSRPKGVDFTNYGVGKGLEIIPLRAVEVIVGIPAYETKSTPSSTERGWADETFLLKYRAVAESEDRGNFIVSGFLGVSIPTGSAAFTAGRPIYTPTIAAGKGWGTRTRGFDIQSTLAWNVPSSEKSRIGQPLVWNTALQAHVLDEHFWPEVELNYTHWSGGPNDGKTQEIVTAGFVAGRFPITGRLRVVLGAGYQWAVNSFRTYDHAWLVSLRTPF